MPSIETIYQESVRPLERGDQIRLAKMIVKRANGRDEQVQKRSILEILEGIRPPKHPRSVAEIDAYLRKERDSWDY